MTECNTIAAQGRYVIEHIRDGEVLSREEIDNLVVNEGLNAMLGVMFNGASQIGTWYIGLFEANYTPVPSVTAATIAAASTESTAYSETNRQEFVEAVPSGQSISNTANKAAFTINATKTIYGAFLVSTSTKGGTSGVLFSASKFATPKSVVSGDQLLITYQVDLAST